MRRSERGRVSKARGGTRPAVVVSELPYGVSKSALLEKVAGLVNEKKLGGISDIRDESTMEGAPRNSAHLGAQFGAQFGALV